MPKKSKGTLSKHGSNPPDLTPAQIHAARIREAGENARWTRELTTAFPVDEANISQHLPLSHRGNAVFLIQARSGDKYVVYMFPHFGAASRTDFKNSNQAIAEILIAFKKSPYYKSNHRIPDATLKYGFGYLTSDLYEIERLLEIVNAQHDLMQYKPPTLEDANSIINFYTIRLPRPASAVGSRSSASSSGFISPAPSSVTATPSPRPTPSSVSASPVPPSSTPDLQKPPKPPGSPITRRKN